MELNTADKLEALYSAFGKEVRVYQLPLGLLTMRVAIPFGLLRLTRGPQGWIVGWYWPRSRTHSSRKSAGFAHRTGEKAHLRWAREEGFPPHETEIPDADIALLRQLIDMAYRYHISGS